MRDQRRHNKLSSIIISILIIFMPGVFVLPVYSKAVFKGESVKSTTPLGYTGYRFYGSYKYDYYNIKWSFFSSKQNIGITVLAMDYENYPKFIMNDSTVHYYKLSNGLKYKDQGIFSVPYNEYWTVIFINLDPDRETVSLTLSVETVLNPLIFYIIPNIVAFSLIFMFIFIYLISKKLKKEIYAAVPLFFITVAYSYYMMFILGGIL